MGVNRLNPVQKATYKKVTSKILIFKNTAINSQHMLMIHIDSFQFIFKTCETL